MSEAHSSKPARKKPVEKPSRDFPLRPKFVSAANGYWVKTIHQKVIYFGAIDDSPDHGAQAALDRYNAEKNDLERR